MITGKEFKEFIKDVELADDDFIAIDNDGLAVVILNSKLQKIRRYAIGGLPRRTAMIKIQIAPQYWCSPLSTVEIPDVKSWADIKEWYVKWDTFHYTVDGENWKEIDLDGCSSLIDSVDMKRPTSVRIVDPITEETLEDSDD